MRVRLVLFLLLVTVIAGAILLARTSERQRVELHVLDIGQGDAILLRSGDSDILVDGGPDTAVLQQLSVVRPLRDRTLDVLVLTHPQRDHLAGLLSLLEREEVGLVMLPEIASETEMFRAFVGELKHRRVPVRFARAGQRLTAGPLTLTVLAPDAPLRELARTNPNNGSVVLRVDARAEEGTSSAFSALLTGDIERIAEQHLVERFSRLLDVDVLKVAHHGSRTSSSSRFLRAATPQLALVSAGKGNSYGHPAPAVLARLNDIVLLRTDSHGTLSLRAERGHLLLSCTRGCAL